MRINGRRDAVPRAKFHNRAHINRETRTMNKHIFEFATALALTLAAVLSIASGAIAGDIIVKDAFARASATPTASSASLYMTIAGSGEADRLVGVTTPAAGSAMIHQSKTVDGVAQMSMLEALDVPATGEVKLEPGGAHVMLMGLKRPLKQGDTVALTLTFEKSGAVEVNVPVGGVAQDSPPAE
jgi:copper(I)-binding protein